MESVGRKEDEKAELSLFCAVGSRAWSTGCRHRRLVERSRQTGITSKGGGINQGHALAGLVIGMWIF